MPVVDVPEKPLDHRGGNHVGDALSYITTVTLECYADHFCVLHYRAAAVAGINLRADLDRQVLIHGRVRVELKINPGHDPCGDRHALAPNRITICRDGRFQRRNPTELQRQHVFEKVRSGDGDYRQVAIVRYELYFGRILIGIAVAFDGEITAIGDHMRICHYAIAAYDKSGADSALKRPGVPRSFVIRV